MSQAVEEPDSGAAPHVYGPPVTVVVEVKVTALAFREADGRYSVTVPAIPGCVTGGETIEDVEGNVRDVVEGLLSVMDDRHREEAIRDLTEPLPGEIGP